MSEISFTEVICQTGKKTAVITLTRMSALNALSFDMLQQMQLWLHAWQQDDAIQGVIIHSETPAAFCAGGDLKALYHNMDTVNSGTIDYFELEYAIDRLIYHYSKPYIALMSGITMGGGVGVSLHGSHPVVFESTRLAMPESKIGFFVDAGVSYHLSRLPYQVGCWMALTGLSIDADDCCALGLSAFKIAIDDYDSVLNALQRTDWGQDPHNTVDIILQSFHQKPDKSLVMQHAPLIADIFQSDRLATITDRILQSTDDWLQATQQALSYNSPNSMQCSLWQMQQAQSVNFDKVIDMDLVLAKKFYAIPDFKEGIRALLIDKDYSPHWLQHGDWVSSLP